MGHDCVRRFGQDAGCASTGAFAAIDGDAGRGPEGRRCGSARPAHGAVRLCHSRRQRGDRLCFADHPRPPHGQFRIRPLHLRLGDDDPARQPLLPRLSHHGHSLPARIPGGWRQFGNSWANLDRAAVFHVGGNRRGHLGTDCPALSRQPDRILLCHAALSGDLCPAHGGTRRRTGGNGSRQ